MERHYTFLKMLTRLLCWLAPFALVGWLVGLFWPALFVGTLLLLLWHLYFQHRLSVWLWRSRAMHPPQAPGSWSDIYDGIYRTLRRAQFRRRQLALLLKRFREAAEAIPDAGMVIQHDGSLVWANRLAQQYFALRWPTDRGIRITELIRDPQFVKYFQQADFRDYFNLRLPDQQRELELRVMPYTDEQWLVIARDMTQVKRLERIRKDFVANVSHELKTPLTVIQGYLELLHDIQHVPEAQQKKALQDMQSQADRMEHLVAQLLQLSRFEMADPDQAQERVNMVAVIQRVVSQTRALQEEKDIEVELDLDPKLAVMGITDKLELVVYNLLTNAIKYSPAHSKVSISWQRRGAQAICWVLDEGPGIASHHIPRLTERFYRVDKGRSSATGGTGLGLSIVKHALEAHHANLRIESTPGRGSSFSFGLPAANS